MDDQLSEKQRVLDELHVARKFVGLMAETTEDTETTGRALMRARVLSGRSGASSEIFPFSWELHTGRFRPMDPKSVGVTNAILSGDMTPHEGEQYAAHMLETTVAAGARR